MMRWKRGETGERIKGQYLVNSVQELLITTSAEGIRKGEGKTATKMMKTLSIIYLENYCLSYIHIHVFCFTG